MNKKIKLNKDKNLWKKLLKKIINKQKIFINLNLI